MHALFISACQHKAIKRTRQVLDSYGLRIGDSTWSTPITTEALEEIRRALRKTATRHTAVACYRNDGRSRMRLLWTVGSSAQFGPQGHFPSGTTSASRSIPKYVPPYARIGCLLAQAAGLGHDLGKGSQTFQQKLRNVPLEVDAVRHEWLSMKLMQAMRQRGCDWNALWQIIQQDLDVPTLGHRTLNNAAHQSLLNPLEALDYLVVSHHGLLRSESTDGPHPMIPTPHGRHIRRVPPPPEQLTPAHGLDVTILRDLQMLENKLIIKTGNQSAAFWKALTTYARAALIFADQTVSAERMPSPGQGQGLYANTARFGDDRHLNQPLDNHLRRVSDRAGSTCYLLTQLQQRPYPSPANTLPSLSEQAIQTINTPAEGRFGWQNTAADTLSALRAQHPDQPVLVLNIAGTGSGKTRMNLRAAVALRRDEYVRLAIALNLRSLTLQTGQQLEQSYRLRQDDLAVIIGDKTTQALFASSQAQASSPDPDNPDESPLEDDLLFTGDNQDIPDWLMSLFHREPRERTILSAPLLVATVDYLAAAGTPGAQQRHIKALLRLMTGDLILDEIDSYEPESLAAVARLVQLAALFRRNVVVSSATLSLPVATAMYNAFSSGVAMLEALEGARSGPDAWTQDSAPRPIGFACVVIDDLLAPSVFCSNDQQGHFQQQYQERLRMLTMALQAQPVTKLARLQRIPAPTQDAWHHAVIQAVTDLHAHNRWDYDDTHTQVSFGLVRVANIQTAITVARALADRLPNASIACYHANDWRIARFHKESRLDALLTRHAGNGHLLVDPEIRQLVDQATNTDKLFIVVATPVEEIGRDHDFDWAVIEPSSAQSIIQTAGRVNRHRRVPCHDIPNIAVLQYNLRHCKNAEHGHPEYPAFLWPGYEATQHRAVGGALYRGHDLATLFPWQDDRLPIHAGLRYNTTLSKLSRADDRAIVDRLLPFWGTGIAGAFNSPQPHSWILTTDPYDKTPLRSRENHPYILRLLVDTYGSSEAEALSRVQETARHLAYRWIPHRLSEREPAANAWLHLTPTEMQEQCRLHGIREEDGMRADLSLYPGQAPDFIYDIGFGIHRAA